MARTLGTLAAAAVLALGAALGSAPAGGGEVAANAADLFAERYGERYGSAGGIRVATTEQPVCGEALTVLADPIRGPGNHPMILHHGRATDDAIVLVHGLSDSPYFMCAIARRLHDAGLNVVMPLLTGHGLRRPRDEIHLADLHERWIEDVRAALRVADRLGRRVSIGGLSTGGLLSVFAAATDPETVDGGVLLFSAALDFDRKAKFAAWCAGLPAGLSSVRLLERITEFCIAEAEEVRDAERDRELSDRNPYRSWFSDYGAYHLALLRRRTLEVLDRESLARPVFAAHSVDDASAYIGGVERLLRDHAPKGRSRLLRLDDESPANCRPFEDGECLQRTAAPEEPCGIEHASVVLAEPIRLGGEPGAEVCEPANPEFADMMAAALRFLDDEVRRR